MAEIVRTSLVVLYRQLLNLRQSVSKKDIKCYDEFKSSFGNFLIRTILPFMHTGQQVMSMPVNRSIISQTVSLVFSGNVASGSIKFLINGISLFLLV